jgi:gamma-glutamyltranspeptidase/glutathione hydrolase
MSPQEAVARPRIHHQWFPNELMVEKTLPRVQRAGLAKRGHKVKQMPPMGVSQIVARSPDGKGFVGAADPRAGGNAVGW